MTLYRIMARSVSFPLYDLEAEPGLSDDEVAALMDSQMLEDIAPVDHASGGDWEILNIEEMGVEPEEPEYPADIRYAKAFPGGCEDYAN